jgi:serralysin
MADRGTAKNDTIVGKIGVRDKFIGLQGSDTFRGNGASDRDIVDYSFDFGSGGRHGITVNLRAGASQGGLAPDTARDSFGFIDRVKGIPDVIGTRYADAIYGGGHNSELDGREGNDLLSGFRGADKLIGGLGADKLYGGTEADQFIYKSIKDSTVASSGRDTIYDFSHAQRDKLHLSTIDATTKKAGNQAFSFIGSQAFHKVAGELRVQKATGGAYVYGDVNGDGKADFAIFMNGISTLAKGDFIL